VLCQGVNEGAKRHARDYIMTRENPNSDSESLRQKIEGNKRAG